jgi:DNA polymerase-3 subunit gamma/tau
MLSKGLGEVQQATTPIAAAEMVLIRLGYAAELPDPADLIRLLTEGGGAAATPPQPSRAPTAPVGEPVAGPPVSGETAPEPIPAHALEGPPPEDHDDDEPAPMPASFRALVDLFFTRGEPVLSAQLANSVHCVALAPGRLDIRPRDGTDPRIAPQIGAHLARWTGRPWDVRISREEGAPTLRDQAAAEKASHYAILAEHPVVAKVLELFPGARIEDVTAPPDTGPNPGVADPGDDELPDDDTAFDIDRLNQA